MVNLILQCWMFWITFRVEIDFESCFEKEKQMNKSWWGSGGTFMGVRTRVNYHYLEIGNNGIGSLVE